MTSRLSSAKSTRHILSVAAFLGLIAVSAASCIEGQIDPADPDALSGAIIIDGATRVEGQPPAPSSGDGPAPEVGEVSVEPVDIPFEAGSASAGVIRIPYYSESGYSSCYVQVAGASDYFEIPLGDGTVEGEVTIPFELPYNLDGGSFSFYTCLAGANGSVSNPVFTSVNIAFSDDPDDEPDGDEYCSDYTAGCDGSTIQSCCDTSINCWYNVNGQRFDCNGSDCTAAAEDAIAATGC